MSDASGVGDRLARVLMTQWMIVWQFFYIIVNSTAGPSTLRTMKFKVIWLKSWVLERDI